MTLKVIYEQTARDDLRATYEWIAEAVTALAYINRIYAHCDKLLMFPERGTPRNDIAPGLRTIGFERKATIAYVLEPGTIRILRVLHKGRDVDRSFRSSH